MRYDAKIKPEVFASKDETRPHMTRVQLDTDAKALIATDGHRLIVTPIADAEADHTGPIDAAALSAARKSARQHGATLGANGAITLPNGATHLRPGDAAEFPAWRQVMPKDDSDVRARVSVDSEYLASIHKAVGKTKVDVIVRGELDPVEFRIKGELGETVILIMPMRR